MEWFGAALAGAIIAVLQLALLRFILKRIAYKPLVALLFLAKLLIWAGSLVGIALADVIGAVWFVGVASVVYIVSALYFYYKQRKEA